MERVDDLFLGLGLRFVSVHACRGGGKFLRGGAASQSCAVIDPSAIDRIKARLVRRARHRHGATRPAQLCRPPSRPMAEPRHGLRAGGSPRATNAGRSDAAASAGIGVEENPTYSGFHVGRFSRRPDWFWPSACLAFGFSYLLRQKIEQRLYLCGGAWPARKHCMHRNRIKFVFR